ncbi:MAG TPA: tetratricopeptide repeat protein, partial [Chthoniobacterales bacterium]|nr:tetratricopeptide repeat protein [Chthoniobacterales bacterium]
MALRKEPARRYQSVDQFSEDIQRHLETRPVLARKDTISYRAGKFIRRNRVGTAAVVLVLLSLLGGIIATAWQAHRANEAKARAERRFNDVREFAHSVLFDYHDAIKDLAGATRVRERLVKDALAYLDSLAGEVSNDPELQRELAAAYERVGDVRGKANAASLGDRAGAIDSYQKALRIRETLVAASPRDVQSRRDLGASYKRIANLLLGTSESERGFERLRDSQKLYSELADEHPDRTDLRRDLAEAHNDLGNAFGERGEMTAALEYYGKALLIYEQLVSSNPKDLPNRRSLSVAYESIGRALFLSGHSDEALEKNEKAMALRQDLVADDPTNSDYRRILGISYQNEGDYQSWLKKTSAALDNFRKKLAIDEQAVADDPANAQAQGDLAYSCLRMGDLSTEVNDHAQALPYYQRSIDIYVKSTETDPADLGRPLQLSRTRGKLAKTHAKLGNIDQARVECSKATDLLLATADDITNADQRRIRVLAYGEVAEAYALLAADKGAAQNLTKEHWRAARDMYQRSFEIMKDLRDKKILDSEEVGEVETIAGK